MNERVKDLAAKAGWGASSDPYHRQAFNVNMFAELIVEEHIKLLNQEWYRLNNEPDVGNEDPRGIGIRVGSKATIVKLIHTIQKHFGIEK